MGRILTQVTIGNIAEPEHRIQCDALVDTGAYCLTLPASWKERLGPLPMSRSLELVTADQRVVAGEICGPLRICIDGFKAIAGEAIFVDVDPAATRFEVLVGYITLEQAGIIVDLVGHRLVPAPYFDLKRVRPRAA